MLLQNRVARLMGTIVRRVKKDGTPSFTAQIRLKQNGLIVHSEAQTFSKEVLAKRWLVKREAELEQGLPQVHEPMIFGVLLERYLSGSNRRQELGRSKFDTLRHMTLDAICSVDVLKLTAADLIAYCRRRSQQVTPATLLNDLVFLKQVLVVARTEWNLPLSLTPMEDALHYARSQRLIQSSPKRERRLEPEEEAALIEYFLNGLHELPMNDLMQFALHSTRRLGEICRIRWEDWNESQKTILVRDVKHPRRKQGHHRRARLTNEALEIILRQPRREERIFPYREGSISHAFRNACQLLNIENLHFHDLRHEGITRLFEKGYAIHEVALFSLHQSWEHLRRYTHLRAENIPDK